MTASRWAAVIVTVGLLAGCVAQPKSEQSASPHAAAAAQPSASRRPSPSPRTAPAAQPSAFVQPSASRQSASPRHQLVAAYLTGGDYYPQYRYAAVFSDGSFVVDGVSKRPTTRFVAADSLAEIQRMLTDPALRKEGARTDAPRHCLGFTYRLVTDEDIAFTACELKSFPASFEMVQLTFTATHAW